MNSGACHSGMVGHGPGGSQPQTIRLVEKGKQSMDSERPNAYVAPGFVYPPEKQESQTLDYRNPDNKAD
jgi:hypothetical protein